MDAQETTVPEVASLAELHSFEVDALDSFATWLMTSGKLPCVFDSLVGIDTLGRYRIAKALV